MCLLSLLILAMMLPSILLAELGILKRSHWLQKISDIINMALSIALQWVV